jgi:acetyl-CoA C-acetyltransferase
MIVASEAAIKAQADPACPHSGHGQRRRCPRVMGIGPVDAAHRVFARTGLSMAQMDVMELNEAFAAQGWPV